MSQPARTCRRQSRLFPHLHIQHRVGWELDAGERGDLGHGGRLGLGLDLAPLPLELWIVRLVPQALSGMKPAFRG
jgi:hypothetical protein